jgi:hypothetical protein
MTDLLTLTSPTFTVELGGSDPSYVIADEGFDAGDPTALTTVVSSLLLDGDRVTGTRSGNRRFALQVLIGGRSRQERDDLTDRLVRSVDASTFHLTWTPDGGDPIRWDCYRAQSTIDWSDVQDKTWLRGVSLTFQAEPFGYAPDARYDSASEGWSSSSGDRWRLLTCPPGTPSRGSARSPMRVDVVTPNTARGVVLHRTRAGAPPADIVAPFFTDGSQQLAVFPAPSLHRGTYSLLLAASSLGPAGVYTPIVTVYQGATPPNGNGNLGTFFTGGSANLSPAYNPEQIPGRVTSIGNVTLPLVEVDEDNDDDYAVWVSVSDDGSGTVCRAPAGASASTSSPSRASPPGAPPLPAGSP